MKICILCSDITKIGGIEKVTSTLVNGFVENGIEVDIVSLFHEHEKPNYAIDRRVNIKYLVEAQHGAKPHSIKRALNMFKQFRIVRNYFKHHSYDLIMAQSYPMAVMLWLSGADLKKAIAVEHVYAGYYNGVLQKLRDIIYRKYRQVVVLTNADKKFFAERGLSENVVSIPNPVPVQTGNQSDCEAKRIISIGRLVYQKGFENLIRGYKSIAEKYPEWKLDIYGDGPMREELQSEIDKEGLREKVTLKGTTNAIKEELQNSSIFVLSSRFEGFPMVLVEAMSQGVPCVAYDCPNGPSDIVETGKNGILVENQNLEELIRSTEELIRNVEQRKEYGKNAPGSVKQYSTDRVVKKWVELFEGI